MTEPAVDLAKSILALVGKFVSSLPADQLTALAAGEARLAVIPKGARINQGSTGGRAAATKPEVSTAQVAADLRKIDNRAAAIGYINDLRLPLGPLRNLSGELGVPVSSKMKKDEVVRTMVEMLVGRRVDGRAISTHAAPARV